MTKEKIILTELRCINMEKAQRYIVDVSGTSRAILDFMQDFLTGKSSIIQIVAKTGSARITFETSNKSFDVELNQSINFVNS